MKLYNFLDVCDSRNLNDVNTFLRLGNNLESIIDSKGFNALQFACVLGYEEIIETLINHGFDIDVSFEYDVIDHDGIFDKLKPHNSKITLFDLCDTKISDKSKVEICRKILVEKGIQLNMRHVNDIVNKINDLDKAVKNIYPGYSIPSFKLTKEELHEFDLLTNIKENNILLLRANNNKMIFHVVEKESKSDYCCVEKIIALNLIDEEIKDDEGNNLLHIACKKLNNSIHFGTTIIMIVSMINHIDIFSTNNSNEIPFDMINDENHLKFIESLIDHTNEKYQKLLRKFQLWKQLKKDKEERDYRVFTESKINELCDRVKSLESMLDTEKNVDKFEDDRKLRKINRLDH